MTERQNPLYKVHRASIKAIVKSRVTSKAKSIKTRFYRPVTALLNKRGLVPSIQADGLTSSSNFEAVDQLRRSAENLCFHAPYGPESIQRSFELQATELELRVSDVQEDTGMEQATIGLDQYRTNSPGRLLSRTHNHLPARLSTYRNHYPIFGDIVDNPSIAGPGSRYPPLVSSTTGIRMMRVRRAIPDSFSDERLRSALQRKPWKSLAQRFAGVHNPRNRPESNPQRQRPTLPQVPMITRSICTGPPRLAMNWEHPDASPREDSALFSHPISDMPRSPTRSTFGVRTVSVPRAGPFRSFHVGQTLDDLPPPNFSRSAVQNRGHEEGRGRGNRGNSHGVGGRHELFYEETILYRQ